MRYRFDVYTLDTQRYELLRGAEVIRLEPKVFDLLTYLLEHRDRVVSRDEVLDHVWPGHYISDASLTARIAAARQAVGDSRKVQRVIQTVHGRGYRFVASVEACEPTLPDDPPRLPPMPVPEAVMPEALDAAPVVEEYKPVTVVAAVLTPPSDVEPEAWHRLRQALLSLALDVLRPYGGGIHRELDDGLVALFGVPVTYEDHAQRAVQGAIALRARFVQLDVRRGLGQTPPALHIGVHTGQVIVGPLGDGSQQTVTPVGDTMAQAVRLQQQAAPDAILVSALTAEHAGAAVALELAEGATRTTGEPATPVYRTPAVATSGSLPHEPAGRLRRSRFVGRTLEITALETLLAQVETGRGQVVGIMGELGIGKSRLCAEFHQRTRPPQRTHWRGRCLSYGRATPYGPLQEVLRRACGLTARDDPNRIAVKIDGLLQALHIAPEDVAPFLLHLLGLTDEAHPVSKLEPQTIKARTFLALRQVCAQRSQQGVLILEIEDLHWIDPTSEEWLAMLIEGLAGLPLMLLVTYRPGYRPPWMDKSYATQLVLPPLQPEESRRVLQEVLHTTSLNEALVTTILQRADGNPLFLEAFALRAREHGSELSTAEVPDTIQAILAARIDQLPQEEKRLLQTAAVIGTEVPFALLQAIAERSEEALHRGLTHLQAAEFVYETSLFPERIYTCKHALTHEVAYSSLLQERRRSLHAQIGQSLEELYAERLTDQVECLAHHALRGEVWDKAVAYSRQAGERAMAHSAYREAEMHFEQALIAVHHLPEHHYVTHKQAIDLRLHLRKALFPLGEHERTLEHLRAAESLAENLADASRLGRIACYLSLYFSVAASAYDRAIAAGQRAITLATAKGEVDLQVLADAALGWSYYSVGDYRQALEVLRNAVTLLESKRNDAYDVGLSILPSVACRAWPALCHAELGTFAEGKAVGEAGVRIAETVDQPYSRIAAYHGVGVLYFRTGDVDQAIAVLERGLTLCKATQISAYFHRIAAVLGSAYTLAGRVAEALRLAKQVMDQVTLGGHISNLAMVLTELSEAFLLVGRLEDANGLAERALVFSRDRQQRGVQAWARQLLGDIVIHRHPLEIEQAEAHYQQALTLANELGMRPLQAHCHRALGTVYGQTARAEPARAELSTAIEMYRDMGMAFWLPETETALAQVEGKA